MYVFENYNSFGGHLFQLPIHSCSYMISLGRLGFERIATSGGATWDTFLGVSVSRVCRALYQ